MTRRASRPRAVALAATAALGSNALQVHAQAGDPLPSWNDGPAKSNIVRFVTDVTTEGSASFVPAAERIATFDNDGTLWSEQPMYFQLAFVFDRIRALAPQNPAWKTQEPFKSALANDPRAALKSGEHAATELLRATHAGMTSEEFDAIVRQWIATAKHPRLERPYNECIYQPMLELLAYLRAQGFKTFIVSGGGVDFMRPWVEHTYGIPPEQVVGSRIKVAYEMQDGKPVIRRLADVDFIDDHAGKPVGIHQMIGRRPIAAFGNSDGDLEMLQWTMAGSGPRFALIVRHTDAKREWAYDRKSPVGKLDKALDEGTARGWTIVDMKHDWKVIFPPPGVGATVSTRSK